MDEIQGRKVVGEGVLCKAIWKRDCDDRGLVI